MHADLHPVLARHLEKIFGAGGVVDGALLAGDSQRFSVLLQLVSDSLHQFERDLQLRSCSLDLSTSELNEANQRLLAQSGQQQQLIDSMRGTANQLLRASSREEIGPQENSIDKLVAMVSGLVGEHEQTRQRLQQSETRVKLALESSNLVYWDMDLAHNTVLLSENARVLFGAALPSFELSVAQLAALIHPRDRPAVNEALRAVLKEEQTDFRVEARILTGDTDVRWLSSYGRVTLRDVDGRALRMTGTAADVSARKRFEGELRDREQRASSLAHLASDWFWEQDAAFRFTKFSNSFQAASGLDPNRLLGRTRWEALPHDALDQGWRDHIKAHQEHQPFYDFEYSFRDADRALRYISISGEPVFDANGQFCGYRGTGKNITERKRAEQKLEENYHFIAELLEAIPSPVSIKDAQRRFVRINAAFTRFFGITPDEIIGRTVEEIPVKVRLRAPNGEFVDQAPLEDELLKQHGTSTHEAHVVTRDGREFDCLILKDVFLNRSGAVDGIVSTTTDITHLKRVQAELLGAKQAAETAMQARTQFLANMSHEIRTPMNGVLGVANLLVETQLNERQRNLVNVIKTSGESLLTIINDILDFSKLDAGKVEVERIEFDLHARLSALIDLFAATARDKNIALELRVDADVPRHVIGDSVRLGQVLSNLIGNAVKFTPKGAVRVSVLRAADDAALPDVPLRLQFVVADTGIGIDPAVQQRIFEPFTQADASTTRRYGGTGLGLTISRQLINIMGGELHVQSAPGSGSMFLFSLPLVPAAACVPDHASASARTALPSTDRMTGENSDEDSSEHSGAHTGAFAGVRVLLAEDNAVNQLVAAEMLGPSGLGCTVTIANNGAEAVALARVGVFDVILMDCQMPVMDGFAATAAIRAQEDEQAGAAGMSGMPAEPFRNIVIAQTAHAMEGDRQACLAARMDDYITKPFDQATLFAVLHRWLAPRRAPAAKMQAKADV